MRTHLTDGELRAALDGELEPGRLRHLETCAACQARRQQLQTSSLETGRLLAFLRPADETGPTARQRMDSILQTNFTTEGVFYD